MAPDTLSQRLRRETTDAHHEAERSGFMMALLDGELGAAAFTALQEQSLLIYDTLEQATRAMDHEPRVTALNDNRLTRFPHLRADLQALDGNLTPRPLPATAGYVTELERIRGHHDVPALLAHHYVRYLGDLSGGQIIARRMQQHYGIAGEALSFYRFTGIEKLKAYKDRYRASIDALEMSDAEADAMVRHASAAFGFNHRVFRELAGTLPR